MQSIDLNADIGEAGHGPDDASWRDAELTILNYVTSASIACGGHAGDQYSMERSVQAARDKHVNIGAHPAYPDRVNFGRSSKRLGLDIDPDQLNQSLANQILTLMDIAAQNHAWVSYVKPHGALYNDAARHRPLANLIATLIKTLHPDLILMGSPGSELETAALKNNVRFVPEGFIDRRYTDDGHLQSRREAGAVITSQTLRQQQALSLALFQTVKTASGNTRSVLAKSLCLHGDSPGATSSARLVRQTLEQAGLEIKAFIA